MTVRKSASPALVILAMTAAGCASQQPQSTSEPVIGLFNAVDRNGRAMPPGRSAPESLEKCLQVDAGQVRAMRSQGMTIAFGCIGAKTGKEYAANTIHPDGRIEQRGIPFQNTAPSAGAPRVNTYRGLPVQEDNAYSPVQPGYVQPQPQQPGFFDQLLGRQPQTTVPYSSYPQNQGGQFGPSSQMVQPGFGGPAYQATPTPMDTIRGWLGGGSSNANPVYTPRY